MWKSTRRLEYIAKEPNFYRVVAIVLVVLRLIMKIATGSFVMADLIKSGIGLIIALLIIESVDRTLNKPM